MILLTSTLKRQEIVFIYSSIHSFLFDVNPQGLDYGKWFVLNPINNVLYPGEKSQTISILFKPDRELNIKDQPVLKCQVSNTYPTSPLLYRCQDISFYQRHLKLFLAFSSVTTINHQDMDVDTYSSLIFFFPRLLILI